MIAEKTEIAMRYILRDAATSITSAFAIKARCKRTIVLISKSANLAYTKKVMCKEKLLPGKNLVMRQHICDCVQ